MKHKAGVEALATAHRAVCTCGWRGQIWATSDEALRSAAQHVADRTAPDSRKCKKIVFRSKRAAEQAVLSARIARALRSSERRLERRCYFCQACEGWHLTSQR